MSHAFRVSSGNLQRSDSEMIGITGFGFQKSLPLAAAIVFLLLLAGSARGADSPPVLVVSEEMTALQLGHWLEYLADESGRMELGGVLSADGGFQPLPAGKISFGYRKGNHWFRFRLRNAGEAPIQLFLEARYALIDSIRFFMPGAEGGFDEVRVGDTVPFHDRPLKHHQFTIPFVLPAGSERTYYLEIHTTSSFELPLVLSTVAGHVEYLHDAQWINGMYYGVLAALFAYNLFLLLITRSRTFLYYIIYVFFTAGYSSAWDGIQFRLFPEALGWQTYSIYVCVNCATAFLVWFSLEFLGMRERRGILLHAMWGMIGLNFVAIASHLVVPVTVSAQLALVVALLSFLLAVVAGFVRTREGYLPARIYLVAFLVMLAVAGLATLSALSILPLYEFSRHAVKVAVALQLVLLSLALGNRINLLRDAEFTARQAAIEAHAQRQATSDFLAKMSHEIRTPMNGVLGMAELMGDTALNRIQQHYLNVIAGSGRALLDVINDILDFSKIEAGHMEVEKLDCNLAEVLDECVCVFALRAEEKHIEFVLSLHPDTPRALRLDPTRVRQVLLNLLGNAFKFTDRGQVILSVRSDPLPNGRQGILVEVRDTGIGIPAAQQEQLFCSFVQADASTTRRYGGTGLGLSISRQLVELMGGTIGVRSTPARGSTFWFRLPVEPAEHPDQVLGRRQVELDGMELLLVSDQTAWCGVMVTEMPAYGVNVTTADSGEQALSMADGGALRPRFIAIDKNLPDESGYLVAGRLRPVVPRSTSILLVTGLREHEDPAQLQAAGISMAVKRPLSSSEFLTVLEQLIQPEEESSRPECSGEGQGPLSQLRVLVAEDNDVNLMVVRGMLGKLGIQPDSVPDGARALKAVTSASSPYDVVLMDCEMPEMDGYTAAREIRAWEREQDIRPVTIIALSAHVMADARQKSLESGMDDHMGKPVNMSVLQQKLAHWTELRQAEPQA